MISSRISKNIVSLCGVILLCGGIACAQNAMEPGPSGSAAVAIGKASRADKTFAKKAMQGGMAEVQLGQLATQKGGAQDVKDFGQRMVTDHTKLNDQMKPIAERIGVNPPTTLSPKDEALMTKLQGESGQQFDKTYIKAMVKDHRKDLMEFRKEAQSGKDPQLKDAAQQGAQVIQQHLQLATNLAKDHHVSVPSGKMKNDSSEDNSASGNPQ